MLRMLLAKPHAWLVPLITALVVVLYALVNYGSSLNLTLNARALPLAIVNLDTGASVGPLRLELGQRALQGVQQNPQIAAKVALSVLPSRAEALEGLRNNRYWAVLILPADFSGKITALSSGKPLRAGDGAVRLEVLTNPAAGAAALSLGQNILEGAARGVAAEVSQQLAAAVEARGAALPARLALQVASPVDTVTTGVVTVGEHSARGASSFYLTFVAMLAGFLAANVVQAVLGEMYGQAVGMGARPHHVSFYLARLGMGLVACLVGSVVSVVIAAFLGLDHTAGLLALILYSFLVSSMAMSLTLLFLIVLGPRGIIVAVLFNIVLFSSLNGSNQPVQTLPSFLRGLADILPFHAATDGMRSLLFYGGRLEAGLSGGLWMLAAYFVGGVVLSCFYVSHLDRQYARTVSSQTVLA
jgi:YhgE/Pip-like protein